MSDLYTALLVIISMNSMKTLGQQSIQNTLVLSNDFKKYALGMILISLVVRLIYVGLPDLLVEEAYYWNYAKHLDFGYLDHPPAIAVLINMTTRLFGDNELAVRLPALLCWGLTALFSFKLTELIKQGAGLFSVFLLSVLPFFFIHSLVITPDAPLTLCWAAALYYLYRALVVNQTRAWYMAGFWIGLGTLSKYTIVLLGPASLIFILFEPTTRRWLIRKEPYLCLILALLIFSPVIYWNATHGWASFIFQSSRRFKSVSSFSLHEYIGLILLFLLPFGVVSLYKLVINQVRATYTVGIRSKRFLTIFTLVPLIFFGVFSLSHAVKFNWIGPGLLAIIPWLSIEITRSSKHYWGWFITAFILLSTYILLMFSITTGKPQIFSNLAFKKFISWQDLTLKFNKLASEVESETQCQPIFIPLDSYNISSELYFYQNKLLAMGLIKKSYPIVGRHVVGGHSLMYKYWSDTRPISGQQIIYITINKKDFLRKLIMNHVAKQPIPQQILAQNQAHTSEIKPYYYLNALMK